MLHWRHHIQTSMTRSTTPVPPKVNAPVHLHSSAGTQGTHICPRTHPSLYRQDRSTSPQMLTNPHAVKHTQRGRIVASTNQWPPNWLPLATTKLRKVGLIECGPENICGVTTVNPSAWSETHPTWLNCSRHQSGGPTDCWLLQLKHVECISLHVDE